MNWNGLSRYWIDLALPLLLIKGGKGILACGYFNIETFNRTGEACAVVTGVSSFDEMLDAVVTNVSQAAAALGVKEGRTTGRQALEFFR